MILAAENLSVTLGRRTVLADVMLSLRPGEVTAVIGPNGAGKSTLLRALAGLLPPAQGTVMLGDRRLVDVDASARARTIGYLPQSRVVHWPLTVARTVALGRMPYGGKNPEDAALIGRAMAEMDVAPFADRPVTELSGGELARVLMARVFAQETSIVLADEPTAGLDPAHQLILLDRLCALAKRGGTVVVALHDLSLAARHCHRIVMLRRGRIVADGTPDAVLTAPLLRETFGIDARLVRLDGIPVVLYAGLC